MVIVMLRRPSPIRIVITRGVGAIGHPSLPVKTGPLLFDRSPPESPVPAGVSAFVGASTRRHTPRRTGLGVPLALQVGHGGPHLGSLTMCGA